MHKIFKLKDTFYCASNLSNFLLEISKLGEKEENLKGNHIL